MSNFVLLGVCFLLGILIRRSGRLPDNAAATLNGFVVNISLPALTLTYVHGLAIDTGLILPALMAWILFGVGCGFFFVAGRLLRLSPMTTGGLMLTGGLGNTSFIGLPMIQTFYGPDWLGLGILIDQVGSYFVLSTLGILVASIYSPAGGEHGLRPRQVLRKVLLFTPFQAFVLALLLNPVAYPPWLEELLRTLGGTLVPLALVSVGYQLHVSQVRGKAAPLAVGLVFKLAIAPALMLLLYAGLLGQHGTALQVTIFEAAMPPMIGASIVAMEHELDPPLLTLMVGIGIPLGFLTLPAWYWVLGGF
ncbi:MAG: AEC family transporter [Rhizobiales bacterium]|nr:AEC family transporter [Hyphomicrobiales bacterium]